MAGSSVLEIWKGTRLTLLSGDVDALPSEFRIFRSGENPSTKGSVWFTRESADAIMAEFERHGADIPLDLEHLSLYPEDRHYSTDAMAWFRLAVRDDENGHPELWAVEVRFTEEGKRRLTQRLQRYTSPAFYSNDKAEVTGLKSVGLVAQPATDQLAPLIAASRNATIQSRSAVNSKAIAKMAEALGLGGDASIMEVFAGLGAFMKSIQDAISGKAPEEPAAPAADPAASAEPEASSAEEDDKEKVVDPTALSAATRSVLKLTGAKDIESINTWRKTYLELEEERQKVAAEKVKLEANERRDLVVALIKAGSETPATAWSDGARTVPAKHLQAMSLEDMRSRVKAFSGKAPPGPHKLPDDATGEHGLTDRELKICKDMGADPAVFARNKALRAGGR